MHTATIFLTYVNIIPKQVRVIKMSFSKRSWSVSWKNAAPPCGTCYAIATEWSVGSHGPTQILSLSTFSPYIILLLKKRNHNRNDIRLNGFNKNCIECHGHRNCGYRIKFTFLMATTTNIMNAYAQHLISMSPKHTSFLYYKVLVVINTRISAMICSFFLIN